MTSRFADPKDRSPAATRIALRDRPSAFEQGDTATPDQAMSPDIGPDGRVVHSELGASADRNNRVRAAVLQALPPRETP